MVACGVLYPRAGGREEATPLDQMIRRRAAVDGAVLLLTVPTSGAECETILLNSGDVNVPYRAI